MWVPVATAEATDSFGWYEILFIKTLGDRGAPKVSDGNSILTTAQTKSFDVLFDFSLLFPSHIQSVRKFC